MSKTNICKMFCSAWFWSCSLSWARVRESGDHAGKSKSNEKVRRLFLDCETCSIERC